MLEFSFSLRKINDCTSGPPSHSGRSYTDLMERRLMFWLQWKCGSHWADHKHTPMSYVTPRDELCYLIVWWLNGGQFKSLCPVDTVLGELITLKICYSSYRTQQLPVIKTKKLLLFQYPTEPWPIIVTILTIRYNNYFISYEHK